MPDRKEAYAAKLRDPRWQKKRLKILERDGWECQECGCNTETLHVHHRYYRRDAEPWDYDDLALVTLCEECHSLEGEERPGYEADLLRILKQAGAMHEDLHFLCLAFANLASNPDPKTISGIIQALEWTMNCPELRARMIEDCASIRHEVAKT